MPPTLWKSSTLIQRIDSARKPACTFTMRSVDLFDLKTMRPTLKFAEDLTTMERPRQRVISLVDVTLRVRDRQILAHTNWEIRNSENWAVLGPNGSGKSTLLRSLTGQTPVVHGAIERHHAVALPTAMGYVSLEQHRHIVAREQHLDEARHFSGRLDSHLTVGRFLGLTDSSQDEHTPSSHAAKPQWHPSSIEFENPSNILKPNGAHPASRAPTSHDPLKAVSTHGKYSQDQILNLFGVSGLLKRAVRFLSTGELRKVLITRALLRSQGILVLDEPFEGLDRKSRQQLAAVVGHIMEAGFQMILATHRLDAIVPGITHVIGLQDGQVFAQGPARKMLTAANLDRLYARAPVAESIAERAAPPAAAPPPDNTRPLIEIRNASVRYGDVQVFAGLNWTVKRGENWAVVGPNGAGKTTLLRMISADHPQAYSNEIYLFGRRRGSGESIWEIKRRLGVVSLEMQVNYRKPIRAAEVVISGFFDSVGLYRLASADQAATTQAWMTRLGLDDLAERRFDRLSFGQRRMVLLARAMVKSPQILVLDEPCQGLDPENRRLILALIDQIGGHFATQILYVTHHPDEIPGCVSNTLRLVAPKSSATAGQTA